MLARPNTLTNVEECNVRRLRAGGAVLGLAALLGTSLLVGCGSSSTDAGSLTGNGSTSTATSASPLTSVSSGSNSYSGPAVSLSFWNGLTGPDKAAVEDLISRFNASHSNIKVTSEPIPWDTLYAKLLPAYGSGNGPDLVGMSSDQIPGYAGKNVLKPIDSIFSDGGIDKSTIVAGALQAGEYNGKLYGVPIESTPVMLYYNKKLFAAAGITSAPRTWDEWAADAKKLTLPGGTGGNPKQYGIAIGTNNTVELFPILMWQADGGILSEDGKQVLLNNAGSKRALQYWANLIANDKISPPSLTGADADKLVSAGTAAMEVNGPWATTGYKQAGIDYGLAPIPTGPNGKNISVGVTTVLSENASLSEDKSKAAAELYRFWTQQDNQAKFSLASGFPPVVTNVPESALASNPDVGAFASQAGDTRALAPGQTAFSSIQNDIFDPTIEKAIANPGQIDQLLDQAAAQVSSAISSGG